MKRRERRLNLADFRATDREECGILVGRRRGRERIATRIVKVPNLAADPSEDYAISMDDLRRVEKSLAPGEVIVGFFHTHLAHHPAEPSDNDKAGARIFPQFLNLIYKPSTGELVWYRATILGE